MCVSPRLSCLVGRGKALSCCGQGCPRAPRRLPRAVKVFFFGGAGFWGLNPPLALPLCPIPLEQAVNCVKGPSGRRYKRPKCSCSAFLLSPSLVLSGITGWGSPTVCPRCKSAHPFPGGSRRQIQAAEVREEKGQSQIPQWGWKSQCEDLRRACLHHPALPQSCLCLAGEGLLLPGNVKIMLGLVSHSKSREDLGGR